MLKLNNLNIKKKEIKEEEAKKEKIINKDDQYVKKKERLSSELLKAFPKSVL